jgi:signal transduction histidine kinase
MEINGTYSMRPAGRHILTIGRYLIHDRHAAIVELIKNAYDADSPDVCITFKASEDRSNYSIIVEDHGHGMSRNTVINKWMVPSTDDKLKRRKSPGGRTMQGRKGVGRYAASILGEDLQLETISHGEKTTVFIKWSDFEKAQYLDEVEILVENEQTDFPSGTRLTITGNSEVISEWVQKDKKDKTQIDKLKDEMKKLVSPVSSVLPDDEAENIFRIYLILENFLENQDEIIEEKVEPYPIVDLFDYRIAGKIGADGKGSLTYSLQKARNTTEESITFDSAKPTGCGELFFDIRVYDREKEAIESLIGRGLKDESGHYMGKLQARQLLNQYNGIRVYRNGFRIRPLGDAGFDWLDLNKRRVQNPSMRIGSNQVIGYVLIESDEQSGLIEKTARDGLRENNAFEQLKTIARKVIARLEERRFDYRKKAGLSRSTLKVERELEKLFSFDELKRDVRETLKKRGVNKKTADEIIKIISKDEEGKNCIADNIRQAVAVYQGQATLGKIINVILHEGRRPLNYFKNEIPNLNHWFGSFKKKHDPEILEKIIPIAGGIGNNADVFVKLFSRLDPLAAGKRSRRSLLLLRKTIEETFEVFMKEMKKSNITTKVGGPSDFRFLSWSQDIYAIFTNLIDNSIYWINGKKSPERKITVDIVTDDNELQYIDYRDTGPGIEPSLIASEVIFEPQFSTKPDGTGLGLAIAGEAASRSGLELKAFESEKGAYFRLQPVGENNG